MGQPNESKSNRSLYAIIGAALGLLFVIAEFAIQSYSSGRSVLQTILLHENRLLYLIDLAPFILAAGGYALGNRHHRLDIINANRARRRLEEAELVGQFGSWEMDLSTNEVSWSKGLYSLYGVEPNSEPSYEKFLEMVHPEDRAGAINNMAIIQRDLPLTFSDERRIVRPDGKIRYYRSSGALVSDTKTGLKRMVGMAQDITEIAEARLAAINAARSAAEFDAIKTIIATYRHEINNPLAIAVGALEMSKESTKLDPKVQIAEKALWRAAEILKRLDELLEKNSAEYKPYADATTKTIKLN